MFYAGVTIFSARVRVEQDQESLAYARWKRWTGECFKYSQSQHGSRVAHHAVSTSHSCRIHVLSLSHYPQTKFRAYPMIHWPSNRVHSHFNILIPVPLHPQPYCTIPRPQRSLASQFELNPHSIPVTPFGYEFSCIYDAVITVKPCVKPCAIPITSTVQWRHFNPSRTILSICS